ncbi:hypothetical protein SAMN05444858_106278 [Micromonospora avicenniae]|uniref:HNH endonuclease n=1 Tax=Micromonospora avicenniae TaxID=1198245 RepID=A0A1N6YEX4_9ACTN|nr:hypothetical protein SAMN05444858_106278 [Micromonospora avicenniae]
MFNLYGRVCHLCGHPGATQADHLDPLANRPNQVPDPTRMRPAHGNRNQVGPGGELFDARCQTCGQACNQDRGAKRLADALAAPEAEGFEDYSDRI